MFKANNKDTTTPSMTSFWCLFCQLWTYWTSFSGISILDFYQIDFCLESPKQACEDLSVSCRILTFCEASLHLVNNRKQNLLLLFTIWSHDQYFSYSFFLFFFLSFFIYLFIYLFWLLVLMVGLMTNLRNQQRMRCRKNHMHLLKNV